MDTQKAPSFPEEAFQVGGHYIFVKGGSVARQRQGPQAASLRPDPGSTLAGCVILSEWLSLSVSVFSSIMKDNPICFIELLHGLN